MIIKQIIGNELYVYINGNLAYKRWLNKGYGIVINDSTHLGRAQGNFKSIDVWQHIKKSSN